MRNKKTKWLATSALSLMMVLNVTAKENVNGGGRYTGGGSSIAAACNPGQAQTELAVNNIRTTILTGGDMWWDLSTARYEIPKGSGAHSMFAGSLWIGGLDASNTLKVAAMTYRQSGNDFWPGPLDTASVSTDIAICDQYDKHFRVKYSDVQSFYDNCVNPQSGYVIPQSILNWPGNGDPSKNQGHYLAPFFDANGDGIYNPYDCDFPDYNVNNRTGCGWKLFGDETLWWVFNDKGNIHTESGSEAIGLEIRAQAFGFTTNDEINNMTFYSYQIINRSFFQINDCYFGQWCDPDLGLYNDDYVGCDVPRGLGFIYNGDADDGGGAPGTYGLNPPALGCDFFQGPLADTSDGIDNDRDCQIDEPGEQLIMSKFVYYDNNGSVRGNPSGGVDIYNYLRGIWRDGTLITYGGNGYNTGAVCNFMFPENTDHQYEFGVGGTCAPLAPGPAQSDWDEVTAGNLPADRRFLQTAGPFTLKPGAVNNITVGLVWARGTGGGNRSAIGLIKIADDKAQKLFDNCFQVLNGPDAPDMTIQELDKQLILYISNKATSNNYLENYTEYDPLIIDTVSPNRFDTTFNFQGYQIFQLKNATVSQADLKNVTLARLVYQCDLKDGVSRIINYNFDASLGANVPVEEVNGGDAGISHSISINQDAFATGDPTLVNHKTYYYMAICYGYNQYAEYKQDIPPDPSNIFAGSYNGQKLPYKAGRRNVKIYSGIPHIPSPEANGTNQSAPYGKGPKITRVEGRGNGGNVLGITDEMREQIRANGFVKLIQYDYSGGPVNVKVVDPLNVPDATFTLKFDGVLTTSNWTLKNNTSGLTISSDKTIAVGNEQLIPEWGLSVNIEQVSDVGTIPTIDESNGYLASSITFADPSKQWLSAVTDVDGFSYANWIRSGTVASADPCANAFNDEGDPNQKFEQVLGGTWAPYRLVARQDGNTPASCYLGGPAFYNFPTQNQIRNTASVDVVFTSDKSKWTRCPVIEMAENPASLTTPNPLAELQGTFTVLKHQMRGGKSVDKNGNVGDGIITNDPNDADYVSATGMGWFPGYAVNLETGERLNMAFGENSTMVTENGRDMKWNPTSSTYSVNGEPLFGGQHYVYVFGHNATDTNSCPRYDEGVWMARKLRKTSNGTPQGTTPSGGMVRVYRDAMWVNVPLLSPGKTLLSSDVVIKLRVKKSYQRFHFITNDPDSANPSLNVNKPMYTFSTADLQVITNDNVSAVKALDLINVVPNPYYAYSEYEKNQVDNRIKVTNLPERCTVKIFTLNGTLIRTFKKDDPKTSLDWDLKNTAGIPIASGMYIIHVNVDGVGERILKWFGVMRPVDLDQF